MSNYNIIIFMGIGDWAQSKYSSFIKIEFNSIKLNFNVKK